ncbi:MAG: ribose 5-phosphate isomerase B [Bdellovibrionales bacterium]|nr:ribose 5-phosphate isomerase B [Bdellovibrionales bacterium]MCB0416113.1 ribose 5-phosphate isomerase B [Bdellovibrionales bacterium]
MHNLPDKVFLGGDHGGFKLKKRLVETLPQLFPQLQFEDLGTYDDSSVNYPEYAAKVATRVSKGEGLGILICGSGIGVCITANKFSNVRAALAWDLTSARLSREHNNANILCLGERLLDPDLAIEICKTWLRTDFEGGRHQIRVDMIHELEKGQSGGAS